jgi:RNA 2',3'-cyclic 3'-phosphodiesterase
LQFVDLRISRRRDGSWFLNYKLQFSNYKFMRLFVAIDLDDPIRQKISRFVEGVSGFAPEVRWMKPEALHLTLKFIGEFNDGRLPELKQALVAVKSEPFNITLAGTGFFFSPKAARVFWVGVQGDEGLAKLASAVDDATAKLAIEREARAYTPHLTLARAGSGRPSRGKEDKPNNRFQQLRERLEKMPQPEFGTMTAREFFLYQSKLSPKGSEYTKLERFTF